MDVRGKHLFGFLLDPERLFVIGCEQAFDTPVSSIRSPVTVTLERTSERAREPGAG
jgi:hypothetical protein